MKNFNNPEEFLKFFSDSCRASPTLEESSPAGEGASAILDAAILVSPMVTIQSVLTMETVPVAMVTGLVAMETGAFCTKLPCTDHVARYRPWCLALVGAESPVFHNTTQHRSHPRRCRSPSRHMPSVPLSQSPHKSTSPIPEEP